MHILRRALDPTLVHDGVLRLDLSGLTFADSTGFNLLATTAAQLGARGGRLVLVRPSEFIRRLLRFMALDQRREIEVSTSA